MSPFYPSPRMLDNFTLDNISERFRGNLSEAEDPGDARARPWKERSRRLPRGRIRPAGAIVVNAGRAPSRGLERRVKKWWSKMLLWNLRSWQATTLAITARPEFVPLEGLPGNQVHRRTNQLFLVSFIAKMGISV